MVIRGGTNGSGKYSHLNICRHFQPLLLEPLQNPTGELQRPELLLREWERLGVNGRRSHGRSAPQLLTVSRRLLDHIIEPGEGQTRTSTSSSIVHKRLGEGEGKAEEERARWRHQELRQGWMRTEIQRGTTPAHGQKHQRHCRLRIRAATKHIRQLQQQQKHRLHRQSFNTLMHTKELARMRIRVRVYKREIKISVFFFKDFLM